MCTGGEVELVNRHGDRVRLKRGESVFADDSDGELRGLGTGEVAQAYTPTADTPEAELTDLV